MSRSRLKLFGALGAAGLAGAVSYMAFRHDIQRAEARISAGGRVIETARGPIEYATTGSGTPVLAIHGAGGGYDQGLLIAGNTFGDGVQILAPSRFGYLRTPVPADVSPPAQAEAHAALLEVLKVEKVIVLGASAGALSSIEFALLHPERVLALILLVPAAYAPGHKVELDHSWTSQLVLRIMMMSADFALWAAMHSVRPMIVRFLGVPPALDQSASQAERDEITAVMESVLPVSWRINGIRIDSEMPIEPRPAHQIKAPTLIVSAHDDLFNTLPAARYLSEQIPNAKLVEYESGGHLLVGHKEELRSVVKAFLKSASIDHSPDRDNH